MTIDPSGIYWDHKVSEFLTFYFGANLKNVIVTTLNINENNTCLVMSYSLRLKFFQVYFLDNFTCVAYILGYSFPSLISCFCIMSDFKW